MSKLVSVVPIGDSSFGVMALSKSFEGLDSFYAELETELSESKYQGPVLLDLLLCNGCKSDRYASVIFDGKKLAFSTYKTEISIPFSAEKASNNFYSINIELIDNSVLTKPQRFLIKKSLRNPRLSW